MLKRRSQRRSLAQIQMIKIYKLKIIKFRGIVDLEIKMSGSNFAICGPNGTGKSGVVDAIEFALSGEVSRLSGKGRGDVSLTEHGPHVDFRNKADESVVLLEGEVVQNKTKFSIKRTVSDRKNPIIEPDTKEMRALITEFGRHKNVSLSRRQLIDYILATPSDRAAQVQALLQLNSLREVRQNLQKLSRTAASEYATAKTARTTAEAAISSLLGVIKPNGELLLAKVNEKRRILSLPEIAAIEPETTVSDGLSVAASEDTRALSKPTVKSTFEHFEASILKLFEQYENDPFADILDRLSHLKSSRDFAAGVLKEQLLRAAQNLVIDGTCPVCDTKWEGTELDQKISEKLAALKSLVDERDTIKAGLEPLALELMAIAAQSREMKKYALRIDAEIDTGPFEAFAKQSESYGTSLRDFISIEAACEAVEQFRSRPDGFDGSVDALKEAISQLPEPTERVAARDFIIRIQERLDTYRAAVIQENIAKDRFEKTQTIFTVFDETFTRRSNEIYDGIRDHFAALYRSINSDDESAFEAELLAQKAGLDLGVDFYGRGKFPPSAYHSEGHQDGMGLCLYLSLMQHLYGGNFTCCVLDDVLMSVDSGHRREVCRMLRDQFPKTQFILTTHDEVWLKNMESAGLVSAGNRLVFRRWSVDSGPVGWRPGDVWGEIDAALHLNDIASAAPKLRQYLEYLSGEMCGNLGAPVIYRGDGRYTLGELLPSASSRLVKLLKEAKAAAQSWSNTSEVESISQFEAQFSKLYRSTQAEQWAVNASVHYNEWANLGAADFVPVVGAFRELSRFLRCDACESLLFVSPRQGTRESLRCGCGKITFNLLKKGG